MSAKGRRKKGRGQSPNPRHAAPRIAGSAQPVMGEIPRPRVTEYNAITIVPVFANGEAGPPSGSPGRYDVVFVLGIPGVSSVATRLDFAALADGGDSLLEGPGLQVELLPRTARLRMWHELSRTPGTGSRGFTSQSLPTASWLPRRRLTTKSCQCSAGLRLKRTLPSK